MMHFPVGIGGTISATRGIILSAKTYKLFANVGLVDA